ncbi:MAG: hypothetical protein K9I85_16185 [Saprospiraceae bacterium]|nr:hypothetical protein [Saprospiraceae bacterium]
MVDANSKEIVELFILNYMGQVQNTIPDPEIHGILGVEEYMDGTYFIVVRRKDGSMIWTTLIVQR